jgi:hypothetical protein
VFDTIVLEKDYIAVLDHILLSMLSIFSLIFNG